MEIGYASPALRAEGGRRWRVGALAALTLLAIAGAALAPRLAQDPAYHRFADDRPLGPIAHAADVVTNLAFVAAGLAGLLALRAGRARLRDPRERAPWVALFAAVALVGPGSAWYHLAPSNDSLLWDRLPMAAAFAALLVAALAERVAAEAARLLWPLVVASVATVVYWWATERLGVGDLRPYAVAQFLPMVAVPLVVALFPERYDLGAGWIAGAALYGLAKVTEQCDAPILRATGLLSGHSLKHLLAGAAIALFAWMVRRRTPSGSPAQRG
jgi:hypothetical protein